MILIGALIFLYARGERPRTLKGHSDIITSVAFSPDGRILASGSPDGTVRLWDTALGQPLRTLSSYGNTDWVAFSPDGHTLASSGSRGNGVVLWDAPSGNRMRVLGVDAEFFGRAAFGPDGRLLVADVKNWGSYDGELRLWDAASGKELRRFPGYAEPVFSPDGKLLAAWNKSHFISLLDVESGNEVRTFGGRKSFLPPAVIFSPDGRLLASDNGNGIVTVWDTASGKETRNIVSASVLGFAFSPDSRLLALGSEDHTIKLWDAASGKKLRTLSGHSDAVNCVAFSPDGRWLASGGADSKVMLWPLPRSR